MKGLTAGAADPDPVAFEHAFDIDHVIDPVCRFRRRLRIRTRGRWRHRPRSRSRIRKGPLWRQLSGAQSLRTIDVFEGSWGSLGSPGGDLGGSSGGLGGVYGWFSGVLGVLGGRGGVLGGSTGRSGRLGRASKNVHFHFFGRWICLRSPAKRPFSKLIDFVAMRCGHCVVQLSCRFSKLAFWETVRWICYKNQLFFNNSDIDILGFQWTNDAENVISRGEVWGPGRSIFR